MLLASEADSAAGDAEFVSLRRLIGQGRYDDATKVCIELIKQHPDLVPLYETLPEVAQYAGNIDGAVAFLDSRVDDGTALPLVYYGLGTAFYGKHDYRAAVVYFNDAIEAGNATPECYRGLEYAYEKLEGIDAATRYFNLLCHREPQNPNNWYGLALAYWTRQDYDRVKSCLSEALTRKPGERRYVQAQVAAAYLRGETDSVAGMMDKLIASATDELDYGGKQFLKSFVVIGHFNRDRYQSAIQTIDEIITDSKTYGCLRWLGWGYKRMSDVKFLMGEYLTALSFAKEAASVAERVGDEELLLASLSREFEVFTEQGDYSDALETAYREQLVTQDKELSREGVRPLVEIACTLHEMGSDKIALEFAIEALGKCETIRGDCRLQSQIHVSLGLIYEGLESYNESIRHYRLAAGLIPKDNFWSRNIAVCHGRLGRALLKLKKYSEAMEHLNRQLLLASRNGYEPEICYAEAYLGMLYLGQGKYSLSRSMFERAYERGSRLGQLPSILICARGLSTLAERSHRLSEAVLWREKAIATTESMGLSHQRPMSLGRSDRELVRDYHEYVRVLCLLHRPDKAFEAAEKAKALSLTKLLSIPFVERRFTGPDSIRVKLLILQREIINLHTLLASEKPPEVPENSSKNSLGLISRLNHLELSFQRILDTLRAQSSLYNEVLNPTVHTVKDIQKSLLDTDGALIEYVVGEENTCVIVISRDTLGSFEVPVTEKETKRLLGRISSVFVNRRGQIGIMNSVLADMNTEALNDLFEVFVKRTLPFIKHANHLTIVSDGALSNFPFELSVTLPCSRGTSDVAANPHFLIEDFEINYALSASTALDEKSVIHHASRPILAIGDPILREAKNEGLGLRNEGHLGPVPPSYVHAYPGVRRELASIKKIFGQAASVFSQNEATMSSFSDHASAYRVLHIAAHVDFNESQPLYSLIELTPDITLDENIGIRAIDFLSLELNADLVVLSGCNTGRSASGTELSGLTSTIMLSGVPSVISSLWNVDDEVTFQIMEAFYSYLKAGCGKGEALRRAKLDLMRTRRSDPFYWGAFVLCGDGGKLTLDEEPRNSYSSGFIVFGSIGVVLMLFMSGLVAWRHHRSAHSS